MVFPSAPTTSLFCFYFMRSRTSLLHGMSNVLHQNFRNITKYDDLTFSVTAAEAKPDLLYLIGSSVLAIPMHFYQDFAEDYVQRYQWRMEPTTGAYEVLPENVDKGRSITLTAVPNWWAREKKHYRYRYNWSGGTFASSATVTGGSSSSKWRTRPLRGEWHRSGHLVQQIQRFGAKRGQRGHCSDHVLQPGPAAELEHVDQFDATDSQGSECAPGAAICEQLGPGVPEDLPRRRGAHAERLRTGTSPSPSPTSRRVRSIPRRPPSASPRPGSPNGTLRASFAMRRVIASHSPSPAPMPA